MQEVWQSAFDFNTGIMRWEKHLPPQSPPRTVTEKVVDDVLEREKIGTERYGVPLSIDSEKDMLREAYEEALDLVVYLRAALDKRDAGC